MKILKCVLILLMASLQVGCGFHLRGTNGSYSFPFQSAYLQCDNVVICNNFKNTITSETITTLVTNPESAEVTLRLFHENTSRDVSSYNQYGRISSYLLTYEVTAQVIQNGEQLNNDILVKVTSTILYNDSTILSSSQDEAQTWQELHQRATNQLITRLVHFQYRKKTFNEVKPNSAS